VGEEREEDGGRVDGSLLRRAMSRQRALVAACMPLFCLARCVPAVVAERGSIQGGNGSGRREEEGRKKA